MKAEIGRKEMSWTVFGHGIQGGYLSINLNVKGGPFPLTCACYFMPKLGQSHIKTHLTLKWQYYLSRMTFKTPIQHSDKHSVLKL